MKAKINKELFKNKTVIGTAIVVIALLVGFGLVPLLNSVINASVCVVRAKSDIQQGTQITSDMIETVKVGKLNLPHGIETTASEVIGKYTTTEIVQDDMIFADKISGQNGTYDLKDGQMLMSMTVKNLASGLSGKLQSGDIVTVFAEGSTQNMGESVTPATVPPELQYVKVAAVTTSTGTDTNTAKKQVSSDSDSNNLPATITLVLNQKQAAVLAGYDNGTLHVALDCRKNDKKAQELLNKQDSYFSQENNTQSSSKAESGVSQ